MNAPLLTIRKPVDLGQMYLTTVDFAVRGYPISLGLTLPKNLVKRVMSRSPVAFGGMFAPVLFGGCSPGASCCSACKSHGHGGTSQKSAKASAYRGVRDALSVVERVASDPRIDDAFAEREASVSPYVLLYEDVMALSQTDDAWQAEELLSDIAQGAHHGDPECILCYQALVDIATLDRLRRDIMKGSRKAANVIVTLEDMASVGDEEAFEYLATLSDLSTTVQGPIELVYSVEAMLGVPEASVVIGQDLIEHVQRKPVVSDHFVRSVFESKAWTNPPEPIRGYAWA